MTRWQHSIAVAAVGLLGTLSTSTLALADRVAGLSPGPIEFQSLGPMCFARSGVLIVGDPTDASIYAIDTQDKAGDGQAMADIADLKSELAKTLKAEADSIRIADLAINPETGHLFLGVMSSSGNTLIQIVGNGKLQPLNLDKVDHAKKLLPNPPASKLVGRGQWKRNQRDSSITDIAFYDGKIMVTGLSAGDSPSRVLELPFPFAENSVTTNVEIFHAAHGRVEDAPIQTFVPMNVGGEPTLLAGFTCTPLVKFPINQMGSEQKVRGTTVAELGNRNRPLDMFVYEKGGQSFVLMSNTARGVMKVSTEGIESNQGLTERVRGGGTAGQSFQTIESLPGVVQMARWGDDQLVVIQDQDDALSLSVVDLP